jgi:hypothetical protein
MRYLLPLLLLAGCAPAPVLPAASPTPPPGADKVQPGKFLFYEDFENGTDKWELPATGWQILAAYSCGGKYSMLLPDAGKPGTTTFTLKEPLDLAKAVKPFLKYDVKGLTNPATAVEVRAEIQPAGKAWLAIGHASQGDHAFVASQVADLVPYVGQAVGLRFVGTTRDGTADSKGMFLDDVAVIEPN